MAEVRHTYEVIDMTGTTHRVTCEYFFNNEGELTMRTGSGRDGRVDATFARGQWMSCVRKEQEAAVA